MMQDNLKQQVRERNTIQSVDVSKRAPFHNTFDSRPTSGSKVISLVPDVEPWKSPRIDYSANVHLTSNYDDYDPQMILQRLQRNKLVHATYDVNLVTQQVRNQFQEIIDSKLSKTDKHYFNVKKLFAEKAPSVIEKIKMQKAEAAARQRKVKEDRRNKNKDTGELRVVDML